MKRSPILWALALCALCGCAFLHSKTNTDPKTGQVTTVVTAYTVFDSQSALAKFQNRGQLTSSNEWAPGTSIGTLNQSATSTNLNEILGVVVGAAVKAAIKP
jgi:hypothetical protein